MSNSNYDKDSGQLFFETTMPALTTKDREWTMLSHTVTQLHVEPETTKRDFYGRPVREHVEVAQGQGRRGARSLKDASIETIINNLRRMTDASIGCLPKQVVAEIWTIINKR